MLVALEFKGKLLFIDFVNFIRIQLNHENTNDSFDQFI
jgi:hypothetical protein